MTDSILVRHSPLGFVLAASPRTIVGLSVFLLIVFTAIASPWLAPHDPLEQDLLNSFLPPFWVSGADPAFLLGTDNLGRDVLSRLIYGTRVALSVALVAATLTGILGTTVGLLAGFYGGWVDTLVSRMVDIWMAFPAVLLSIVLVAVIGAGLHAVIIAIIVIDWTRFCRVVRAETMVQCQQDYVASAVTIGLSRRRRLFKEILPNILPLLISLLTLEMGIAVVVEAILSYVGLSVASDAATWGGLIQEGRLYINQAPWLMVFPITCIVVAVLGFNALGDGLRSTLDPVLRR
ncbi:MAG: ABC transporter permease [Arenicellales bacterium]|jgi:peptide/nickel transport system permease protein|nr:ABC transporter permease [Arenicellales bacterium]|tara:strand:- start:1787 stop:2659 length:873 start_codon:yes stop_codon:yes gene_type:complete